MTDDRRSGQRGRREDDDLVMISARWADSVDAKLSDLADREAKLVEILEDQEKIIKVLSYYTGIDAEGHVKQGGMADFYILTKSARRLLIFIAGIGAGATWLFTTGLDLLKEIIRRSVGS